MLLFILRLYISIIVKLISLLWEVAVILSRPYVKPPPLPCPLLALPLEIFYKTLEGMYYLELLRISATCKSIRNFVHQDPRFDQARFLSPFDGQDTSNDSSPFFLHPVFHEKATRVPAIMNKHPSQSSPFYRRLFCSCSTKLDRIPVGNENATEPPMADINVYRRKGGPLKVTNDGKVVTVKRLAKAMAGVKSGVTHEENEARKEANRKILRETVRTARAEGREHELVN